VRGVARSSYDPLGTAILGVEQLVETSGLPTLRRDAAREAARAASAQRQRVERRVALDVEAALIELALQDQLVEEQRVLLERIQEAERIIVARVAAGAAARYDAHRIAIARAIAEAELESAEADRALLHGQLMAAVGPGAGALVGAPALPEARALGGLDALQEQARTSPALLQAMADAAEARAAIAIARAEVFPGIRVKLVAGFGQGPGQWDLGLGVSAPLPLLNDGSSAIEAAEQRAIAAKRALEASEIALRRMVQTAYETAVAQREALERFMARVEGLQDTAVAEATAQYREGGLSALELLDAFTLRTTIQRQRIQLERAARLAELRTREALLGE
jgi:outer membrane protein, heavy metal efflux system